MGNPMVLNKTKNLFDRAARRAARAFGDTELCGELNSLSARARAAEEEWIRARRESAPAKRASTEG